MSRTRRYYESGSLYEVTIRTREGLPFACKESIELLIKSALARTQRDFKVRVVQFVWMGNHAHILVICYDATKFSRFYGELQKKITDYVKRLLGKDHLWLWEGRPGVHKVADLEAAIERIAYFYANPAKANLVDSIEQYPGYSTFSIFQGTNNTLFNRTTEKIPWIRCPAVQKLPDLNLSPKLDKHLKAKFVRSAKQSHRLTVFPNLWMLCFGLRTREEICAINQKILMQLRVLEQAARDTREQRSIKTIGANKLVEQSIMSPHTPKKYGRKIFVMARSKEIRIAYIQHVKRICEKCKECYQRWKNLDFSFTWPPGTFPPSLPMAANALT